MTVAAKTNIVVIYNGANLLALQGVRGDYVRLKPGKNVVDLGLWQRVTKVAVDKQPSTLSMLMDQGLVNVLQPEAPSEYVPGDADGDGDTDIGAFNAKTAIELVENTFTDDELDALEAEEHAGKNRKTVLAAIADQRKKITPDEGDR